MLYGFGVGKKKKEKGGRRGGEEVNVFWRYYATNRREIENAANTFSSLLPAAGLRNL